MLRLATAQNSNFVNVNDINGSIMTVENDGDNNNGDDDVVRSLRGSVVKVLTQNGV